MKTKKTSIMPQPAQMKYTHQLGKNAPKNNRID